jgi:DNA-binding NarL/FixJ family response regulator
MNRITILIADDHAVVRQGIRTFLELDPSFEVVGEACDGAEAIAMARELEPAVVLMDLMMPRVSGLEAIAAIRKELPDTEVLALTSFLEDGNVLQAMRAGAVGYLLKDAEAADLRQAIKAAAAGQVQLSPKAAAKLLQTFNPVPTREALTPRENDVLRLLARGQSNKQIAESLTIGETTAKTHVRSILSKLGVASRLEASLYAIRGGMV